MTKTKKHKENLLFPENRKRLPDGRYANNTDYWKARALKAENCLLNQGKLMSRLASSCLELSRMRITVAELTNKLNKINNIAIL